MKNQSLLLLLSFLLGDPAVAKAQDHFLAMVIDDSGSMTAPTLYCGGPTRMAAAKTCAIADVNAWFSGVPGTPYAVIYHFSGCGVVRSPASGWHASAPAAIAVINSLSAVSSTPLLQAVDLAMADLVSQTVSNTQKAICVYSDGVDTCYGAGTPPRDTNALHDHCAGAPGATAANTYAAGTEEAALCGLAADVALLDFCVMGVVTIADGAIDPVLEALARRGRGRLVLGADNSSVTPWSVTGLGCRDIGGTRLHMRHFGTPHVGITVEVGTGTSQLRSFILIGPEFPIAPVPLASLGAPGCTLYINPSALSVSTASNQLISLNIPNAPGLVGLAVSFQGAQLHPGNNALGVALSNRLDLVLLP